MLPAHDHRLSELPGALQVRREQARNQAARADQVRQVRRVDRHREPAAGRDDPAPGYDAAGRAGAGAHSARDTAPSTAPGTAPGTGRTPALPENRKREAGTGTITGRDLHKMGLVELPKDKRFSLAVIQGAATGQIFQITKTRTTMGRSGADINLDDPEASRQHAMLEVIGDHAIVRDLGSTNGTFVDLERIEQQVLNNHMEFRIGSHVLMFIVTDVE
jgi:FHA domain-containing protein